MSWGENILDCELKEEATHANQNHGDIDLRSNVECRRDRDPESA